MRREKAIGWFLIIGAVGVLVPYTILTITFEYPDILRKDTGDILIRFNEGGSSLIWTWFEYTEKAQNTPSNVEESFPCILRAICGFRVNVFIAHGIH